MPVQVTWYKYEGVGFRNQRDVTAGWKLLFCHNKQIACVRNNRFFVSAGVIFQENLLESGITWYSEYSSVLASISYLRRLLLMTLYVLSSADTWKQWKIFHLKNRELLRGYAARVLSCLFLTNIFRAIMTISWNTYENAFVHMLVATINHYFCNFFFIV